MTDLIGKRIRTWRRRRGGMSQKTLADLAGVSQAFISMVESGERALDRKSTQVNIAAALNITVAQLMGQPDDPTDPLRAQAVKHVPAIRSTLVEIASGERRTPVRDRNSLRLAVREATELRNAADYATLAPLLPDLLIELAAHGQDLAPEMIETLFCTRYVLKSMGYPDLGMKAADTSLLVAREHDDAAWTGQAVYNYVQAFPPENAALGTRLLERAANDLQSNADQSAQEVYGCLHILAGFQAAIATKADQASAHLAEAADVARSLGEPEQYASLSAGFNGNWFGPTQVEYWRVAVAAELGDAGEAIKVTKRIDLDAVPVPNRHVYYWTDLARALAAGNKNAEAMHALANAERAAPQHFRFNPVALNLVTSLVYRAKKNAIDPELAGLARKLGIEPI